MGFSQESDLPLLSSRCFILCDGHLLEGLGVLVLVNLFQSIHLLLGLGVLVGLVSYTFLQPLNTFTQQLNLFLREENNFPEDYDCIFTTFALVQLRSKVWELLVE
jgi:hypothetical protein